MLQTLSNSKRHIVFLHTIRPCIFFLPACSLVTRSNFLLSPDGISRGWPLVPNIKFLTPSLSCVNHRWTQYGWKCTKTEKKGEEKNLGQSYSTFTVLLLFWNNLAEGLAQTQKGFSAGWMLKITVIQSYMRTQPWEPVVLVWFTVFIFRIFYPCLKTIKLSLLWYRVD